MIGMVIRRGRNHLLIHRDRLSEVVDRSRPLHDDVLHTASQRVAALHLAIHPPHTMFGFLPFLTFHRDAASFYHSVLPFYSSAMKHIFEYRSVGDIYSTTNPFVFGSFFSITTSLSVFVISSVTGNWSWYITPPSAC